MNNMEKKISKYIDQLNKEKKPREHEKNIADSEYEELMGVVRLLKSTKEPDYPGEDFAEHLKASAGCNIPGKIRTGRKKIWIPAAAVAAAALIAVVIFSYVLPKLNPNVVYAMEQAFKEVKAYHGILVTTQTNDLGEKTTQATREIWADKDGKYYVKELDESGNGSITINNGLKKWQIQPEAKQILTYPAFPDPYRFTFEIGNEIENVKNALEVKVVGEEEIAGRRTSVLEVTPQGGDTYRLWIDKETDMPLQKQSPKVNALQYTVTYIDIEFTEAIPQELISYKVPEGYEVTETDTEQFVGDMEEAVYVAGFSPKLPEQIPEGYQLKDISVDVKTNGIKMYYTTKDKQKTAVFYQQEAVGTFEPDSAAILGKVNDSTAEILAGQDAANIGAGFYLEENEISSIRWRENNMEYSVYGNLTVDELAGFAEKLVSGDVIIPEEEESGTDKPQIEVPVDLEIETNEQKSVDGGHSPWKLDPVYVTQVFVSLLISPEGIVGDYPIASEDIKIIENNGKSAIAEISGDITPAGRVYLKRLIRQDSTGIWTVVGYDPANDN